MAKCHRAHVSTAAMTTMRMSTVTMIMGVIQLLVAGLHGVLTALEMVGRPAKKPAHGAQKALRNYGASLKSLFS